MEARCVISSDDVRSAAVYSLTLDGTAAREERQQTGNEPDYACVREVVAADQHLLQQIPRT